jgi:large subunit ribosomal protein L10
VAKVLRDFSKSNPALVVKGGVLGSNLLSAEEAAALAEVAPREELLARLAGGLAAPMVRMAGLLQALPRNFAYGLAALIDQQGGVPATAEAEPEASETAETATDTAEGDAAEADTAAAVSPEASDDAAEAATDTAEAPADADTDADADSADADSPQASDDNDDTDSPQASEEREA